MVASGTYEALLPDIADVLISGTSAQSQKFLAAVGVYQEIQKETRSRARVSCCAAIASVVFRCFVTSFGILLMCNS